MHRILLYNEKWVTVTMTKTDIIDRLASETGVTKTDTKMMRNAFLKVISEELTKGEAGRLPSSDPVGFPLETRNNSERR